MLSHIGLDLVVVVLGYYLLGHVSVKPHVVHLHGVLDLVQVKCGPGVVLFAWLHEPL